MSYYHHHHHHHHQEIPDGSNNSNCIVINDSDSEEKEEDNDDDNDTNPLLQVLKVVIPTVPQQRNKIQIIKVGDSGVEIEIESDASNDDTETGTEIETETLCENDNDSIRSSSLSSRPITTAEITATSSLLLSPSESARMTMREENDVGNDAATTSAVSLNDDDVLLLRGRGSGSNDNEENIEFHDMIIPRKQDTAILEEIEQAVRQNNVQQQKMRSSINNNSSEQQSDQHGDDDSSNNEASNNNDEVLGNNIGAAVTADCDNTYTDSNNKAHVPGVTVSSNEDILHILAPSGKLGLAIDIIQNETVVFIVQNSSSLVGKVQVGDKLVAVDNEDVRTLTISAVLKLLSQKSTNPSRKLTILRTKAMCTINPSNVLNNDESLHRLKEIHKMEIVTILRETDVIMGCRGGSKRSNEYPSNKFLKKILVDKCIDYYSESIQPGYEKAKRKKTTVANAIIDILENRDVRFLKRICSKTNKYNIVLDRRIKRDFIQRQYRESIPYQQPTTSELTTMHILPTEACRAATELKNVDDTLSILQQRQRQRQRQRRRIDVETKSNVATKAKQKTDEVKAAAATAELEAERRELLQRTAVAANANQETIERITAKADAQAKAEEVEAEKLKRIEVEVQERKYRIAVTELKKKVEEEEVRNIIAAKADAKAKVEKELWNRIRLHVEDEEVKSREAATELKTNIEKEERRKLIAAKADAKTNAAQEIWNRIRIHVEEQKRQSGEVATELKTKAEEEIRQTNIAAAATILTPQQQQQQQHHSRSNVDDSKNPIIDPRESDVLCGRGGASLRHPGNLTYQRLVNLSKGLYITCLKTEKLKISRSIVAAIREQRGRFLEQDATTGVWTDIGDKKAVGKTSQALREGQPKLRKKMVELGQIPADQLVAADHVVDPVQQQQNYRNRIYNLRQQQNNMNMNMNMNMNNKNNMNNNFGDGSQEFPNSNHLGYSQQQQQLELEQQQRNQIAMMKRRSQQAQHQLYNSFNNNNSSFNNNSFSEIPAPLRSTCKVSSSSSSSAISKNPKSSNRGLQKFKRQKLADGKNYLHNRVTANATSLKQALSRCYSSLDASRTDKVSLMKSNSIKNNVSNPRGEEYRNDRSAKKDSSKSKKRTEKDCKHKQTPTNTGSVVKKRRRKDDDGGYESWTAGNWCLLLPHNNVDAQIKPAVRVMANCSHKHQLGERKSSMEAAEESWPCRGCTFKNEDLSAVSCSMCGKYRLRIVSSNHKRPYTDSSKQPTAPVSSPIYSSKRVAVSTSPPRKIATNTSSTMIKEPHRHDILLGKSRCRNASHPHFGNRFYRRLIEEQYADYARCTDTQQKNNIKQSIFDEIKNTHDPSGRFLKRSNDGTKLWNEISPKEACNKILADLHRRKYKSVEMRHQQQSKSSNAKSPTNVQQYHSSLLSNDNAISIPKKRGKVAATSMTRSTISEPACSVAEQKRHHLLYNEAVQRARDYMLSNYGHEYVENHEEEEMVMV